MKQQTVGRPKGAKNVETIQIVQTPACPACGVTDRTKYRLVSVLNYPGITSTGQHYTHIIARRTKCKGCSKVRIDKFFENQVPEANPGDENEPLSSKD